MEITVDQIANVPPRETARWLARFTVIELSLKTIKGDWMEDWGGGGQRLSYLGQAAVAGEDITSKRDYQQEKLLTLSRLLPTAGRVPDVPQSAELSPEETERELAEIQRLAAVRRTAFPSGKETNAEESGRILAERRISRRLRFEAAQAVGIVNEAGLSVGALAVYAMERADIHQPADRLLYVEEDEIKNELITIRANLRNQPGNINKSFKVLYGEGTATPDKEAYDRWWALLAEDMATVDAAVSDNS